MTVLVLDSRMSHHYRPYPSGTAPCLQLRQHQPHLLRLRGSAAALRHVDEYVGVYHQEVEAVLAHVALSHRYDVVAVGQARLRVEIHHVLRQVADNLAVHLPGISLLHSLVHAGGVFHSQCHPRYLPDVLRLDRFFEGEERHALLALEHQMCHHAVQKISLSGVRDARQDDESAVGGRVEDAVGEHAHAHVISLVVVAHHHFQDIGFVLVQVVDVLCRHVFRLLYDSPHLVGSEGGINVADVLAVAGEMHHLGACGIGVEQRLHHASAGSVGISADDDFLHLGYPFLEGLVALVDVGLGAVGDAQHVGESAAHQR